MSQIQCQDVTKAYGQKKLFQEVTVTFSAGRRYGVTGPNGGGGRSFGARRGVSRMAPGGRP